MSDREVRFTAREEALREDVHTLGALVGDVVREQGGEALFTRVEAVRRAAILRREGGVEDDAGLALAVRSDTPGAAESLVRAFSTYFGVVNLVEKVHRIRRRREYLRTPEAPQPGSFLETVKHFADEGMTLADVRALLGSLVVEPVFTAHPTESTRRTLLRKEQRIARHLVSRLDPSRTPDEEQAALGQVRAEVTAGWQTDEHPSARPTVADEREHVLFYVTDVLYRVVPPLYESIDTALVEVYGAEAADEPLPTIVRFASWVGGDMDGNPNVSAATIRETLRRQRDLILGRYLGELDHLYGRLSQSEGRVGISLALRDRIEEDPLRDTVLADMPPRHRDMPYRVLLSLMYRRLENTRDDGEEAYVGPDALLRDLGTIADSLRDHAGEHAGLFSVRRAHRRVATFGFHLATLDVRQDAEVHRRVLGRLLGDDGWEERSAARRTERLRRSLADGEPPADVSDPETLAVLDVFDAIRECRARYGSLAVGPYIISMARDADDVLGVLQLARWRGLGDREGVPLDVAPLFETVPDLEASPSVMQTLLGDRGYRRHLAGRRDRQIVMIGYSDSNKDGGLASARWALFRGQAALVSALEGSGVSLVFFHGRGGSISRGGGKTRRALAASPPGSVAGYLRVTEQGEMIHEKFGLRGIALRTLEQATSALARTSGSRPHPDERHAAWAEIMETVASVSRVVYRALVYEDPRFLDYFRQATPIDVIERMAIGSRPTSRRSKMGLSNLRAIPWVFAWTQSRHILPGWYGLGAGLAAAVDAHGHDAVATMVREWPFARALFDDAEMVLAKADMPIAEHYASLADPEPATLFATVRSAYDETVARVLDLGGRAALLDGDRNLQRSIRLRNPYVDPMSLLQVDLLRRWRDGGREDEAHFAALLATVRGIAAGLQNTG